MICLFVFNIYIYFYICLYSISKIKKLSIFLYGKFLLPRFRSLFLGAIGEAFEKHLETFGGLDICINNAGITSRVPFQKDETDGTYSWRHVIDVNFMALVDGTRLAVCCINKSANSDHALGIETNFCHFRFTLTQHLSFYVLRGLSKFFDLFTLALNSLDVTQLVKISSYRAPWR